MPKQSLSKREQDVLSVAIKFGWEIQYDSKGRAVWDGDSLLPFRAHATVERLIRRGLMARISDGLYGCLIRATDKAHAYRCKAAGCQRGTVYEDDEHGCYSREVGKCPVCNGTCVLTELPAPPKDTADEQ